jgi:hypothetical protein
MEASRGSADGAPDSESFRFWDGNQTYIFHGKEVSFTTIVAGAFNETLIERCGEVELLERYSHAP